MPDKSDAWYLTEAEREHAYKRLGEPRKHVWDRTVFKRVLLSWQFWLLPFIFMRSNLPTPNLCQTLTSCSVYSLAIQMELNNVFQLWMASRGYTVIQQNNYPTGLYASAIIATIGYSAISDKIQSRWQCSLIIGLTFVVGSSILIANPAKDASHFFAYYLLGSTYAPQALWYAWMADVTAHDYQLRAITTGFMNSFGGSSSFPVSGRSDENEVTDILIRLCVCDLVATDLLPCNGCAKLSEGIYCKSCYGNSHPSACGGDCVFGEERC